ncbi:hypothetical protein SBDP1_110011 [Syntrophobacter sp. SbD1]|nr:hypothetical protein SBDP1_110011 [Syntrophobacter sp. SbD1]
MRGGVHGYAAQANPKIDDARAEKDPFRIDDARAEKDPFRMETSYLRNRDFQDGSAVTERIAFPRLTGTTQE